MDGAFNNKWLTFTVPSQKVYGLAAWKWDVVFGSIIASDLADLIVQHEDLRAYRKYVPALRKIALGSLVVALSNQVQEGPNRGMVPHMNFSKGKFEKVFSHPSHSYITQPPIVALGVQRLGDAEVSKKLLPYLLDEAAWWWKNRMHQDLPYVIHSWETGADASPESDLVYTDYFGEPSAEKLAQMANDPNSLKNPYLWKARALLNEKLKGGDVLNTSAKDVIAQSGFALQTPMMAALLVNHLEITAAMAKEVGDQVSSAQLNERASRIRKAANQQLWAKNHNLYFAKSVVPLDVARARTRLNDLQQPVSDYALTLEGEQILAKVGHAFTAFFAGLPTLEQAEGLLEALESPDFNTPWAVPTVATSESYYNPREYWRGSSWININYLIVKGLGRYAEEFSESGQNQLAARFGTMAQQLARQSLEMVAHGYYEYYASDGQDYTGRVGEGPGVFTWSALSLGLIEVLAEADAI